MLDIRKASLAACLCFGAACTPQTIINSSVPTASTPSRGITVTGLGKANGKPNVARATVGFEARAASAEQAIAEVNARMTQVIAAVKRAGVADADVRTATLSLNFERIYEPPRPVDAAASAPALAPAPAVAAAPAQGSGKPKGAAAKPSSPSPTDALAAPPPKLPQGFYNATNSVELTIRNLDSTGNVVSAATGAGANQVYGLRFDLEDPSPLQVEARKKAMADARQRAERLAQLAGVKLGPAVSISENDSGGGSSPVPAFAMMKTDASAPVERGELTVTTTVQVVFALGN